MVAGVPTIVECFMYQVDVADVTLSSDVLATFTHSITANGNVHFIELAKE